MDRLKPCVKAIQPRTGAALHVSALIRATCGSLFFFSGRPFWRALRSLSRLRAHITTVCIK